MNGQNECSAPLGEAHFGDGTGEILLDEVQCQRGEGPLWQYSHNVWFVNHCFRQEDAGVICADNF